MAMQPNIILAGQQPDFVNTLARATQAGEMTNKAQQNNALRNLYASQGDQIMQGDQGAVNALARIDPQQAMGIQETRQQMQFSREKMQMLRDQAKMQAMESVARLSAEERAAAKERLEGVLNGAAQFYQSGDRAGFQNWVQQNGLDPAQYSFDQFPAHLAKATGTIEALTEAQDYQQGPEADYVTINDQLVNRSAPGGPAVVPVQGLETGGSDSAAEQKISRIMELTNPSTQQPFTRDEAIAITELYDVSTDPVTRELRIINKATGQPVGGAQIADPATPPGATPPPQQPQGGTNAENAFGIRGMAGQAANTASDWLGLGEVFPGVASNVRDFKVLEEDLLVDMAQAYPRMPAKDLMESLRSLAPQPGRDGPSQAQGELKSLKNKFEGDLRGVENQLNTRRLSPTDRAELQSQANGLRSAINRVDGALSRFGGGTDDIDSIADKWAD